MTATVPIRANQREHILDEALSLMARHGSSGTSMRQIATACGVQVAAIYHYFPSKDALLRTVFEERRYSSRLADEAVDIDPAAAPVDRLRRVVDVFWNGALEEEPVLKLLLGEALRNEPYALATGSELLDIFSSGVVMLLETHVPEIDDPLEVASLFISMIFSGFIRHTFDPLADTDAIASDLADTLIRAVPLGP